MSAVCFCECLKLLRVTLEHFCESWKDSNTFQGLAALFHTLLPVMARTTAPNLSLILSESQYTPKEQRSCSSEYVNTLYLIHGFKCYYSEPMVNSQFNGIRWNTLSVQCSVLHMYTFLSVSHTSTCKTKTLIYLERESYGWFNGARTGVCLIHQSINSFLVLRGGFFPLRIIGGLD